MSRRTLSDRAVGNLKVTGKRYAFPDPELRGHYVRVAASGSKGYVVQARSPDGRQVWHTIGSTDLIGIEDARTLAKLAIQRIRAGLPPQDSREAQPTFRAVSELFLTRHVDRNRLRSADDMRRKFKAYIWPEWGERPFADIRRDAVVRLLDRIEDGTAGVGGDLGGPVQADRVLALLRKLFNWHAARDEAYTSPIIIGMARTRPKERARSRVIGQQADGGIDDDELRLFWSTAADAGPYGAFLQLCLFTGQRRAKVMAMRWDAVSDDGVWTIAAGEREKNSAGVLDLPQGALAIIRAQPRITDNLHVFAGRGEAAMHPGDKLKKDFDDRLANANGGAAMPHWTIHDLRRTAKSLMRRAGVSAEVSERVLGHAIAGVEGTYDRYGYRAEKAQALKALAGLVQLIVEPAGDRVVPLRTKG